MAVSTARAEHQLEHVGSRQPAAAAGSRQPDPTRRMTTEPQANPPQPPQPQPPSATPRQRGWEAYNRGDLRQARLAFEEALRLDAHDALAHAGRGMVHAAEDEYGAAVAAYSRAIEAQPDYALAW